MRDMQPAAILEVEAFALVHAQEQGRGVVVLAIDGSLAQLVFVPMESWKADPIPGYENETRIERWLAEYDPKVQYILIQGVREGESIALRPFCLPYMLIKPTSPLAVAA